MREGSRRAVAAAVLAAAGIVACGGEASPPAVAEATVRDSAGVRIVENGDVRVSPELAWGIGDTPEVVIGADPDASREGQLDRVRDAARLSDGRIAVLDGGSNELRIYGSDGGHDVTLGGAGQGPGEFQYAFLMDRLPGDTLLVWDPMLLRSSWLTVVGGFVRSVGLDATRAAAAVTRPFNPAVGGVRRDGMVRVTPFEPSAWAEPVPGEVYRLRAGLIMTDTAFSSFDTIAFFPTQERVLLEVSRGPLDAPVLNARGTSAGDGIASPRLCLGDQAATAIECFDGDGSRMSVRWTQAPVALSPTEVQALRDDYRARSTRWPPEVVEEIVDELPVMETHPFFTDIHVDALDHVWAVGTPRGAGEGGVAGLVFDAVGTLLGRVVLPDLEIFEIGEDYVLGVARDDFDVERVELYRLSR